MMRTMILIWCSIGLGWSQSGNITGIVGREGGVVERAAVMISAHPTVFDGPGPKAWTAYQMSAKDGSFRFDKVPTGTYRICIQPPPTMDLLSTCPSPDSVMTVKVSGATSMGTVRLKSGVRLKARLDDAQGLMAKSEGKVAGAYIVLGVWLGSHFSPFRVVAEDSGGRDLECVIPLGTPARLSASAGRYTVNGPSGTALDATKEFRSDMNVANVAAAPGVFRFQVVGFK